MTSPKGSIGRGICQLAPFSGSRYLLTTAGDTSVVANFVSKNRHPPSHPASLGRSQPCQSLNSPGKPRRDRASVPVQPAGKAALEADPLPCSPDFRALGHRAPLFLLFSPRSSRRHGRSSFSRGHEETRQGSSRSRPPLPVPLILPDLARAAAHGTETTGG